jgi:hypothetical protein
LRPQMRHADVRATLRVCRLIQKGLLIYLC